MKKKIKIMCLSYLKYACFLSNFCDCGFLKNTISCGYLNINTCLVKIMVEVYV